MTTLENAPIWVDQLAWNSTINQLAFSLGRYIQVWDADRAETVATLNFEHSSPTCIDWRSDGQYLAVGGYKGVKIWRTGDWDDDPFILAMSTVSVTIAWSPDCKYLVSGNMDRTIAVLEWENPEPWIMRGFPGKIRLLAWSNAKNQGLDTPFFASSSLEGIVVWSKSPDPSVGWSARVLANHLDTIRAIAFAPHSSLLASAGADGWLCLWHEAEFVSQILTDVSAGFSTVAWGLQGELLAAGGEQGELLIWS
jgi:WD40 repeat protein